MSVQPPARLVVTGGSGFIGRHVLEQLSTQRVDSVTVLTRDPSRIARSRWWQSSWQAVAYGQALSDASAVNWRSASILHLAAATGRAHPREMERVNVEETATLARFAVAAGAQHFILVSSIAAAYRDRRWYPYAQSKLAAENLLKSLGMPFTIVRPTLVFGEGSPVQQGLATLASLPVPLLFGHGHVRTQPIDVHDVARLLVAMANEQPRDDVVEVGGPEVVTMSELFGRLRASAGRSPRSPIHAPVALVRRLLALVEPALRPLLPLTAGQLAVFVNDSTAAPSETVARLLPAPRSIEAMLARQGSS